MIMYELLQRSARCDLKLVRPATYHFPSLLRHSSLRTNDLGHSSLRVTRTLRYVHIAWFLTAWCANGYERPGFGGLGVVTFLAAISDGFGCFSKRKSFCQMPNVQIADMEHMFFVCRMRGIGPHM
jgi:hypothetical protein